MTTAPTNQDQGLTPESLANRLFDMALTQSTTKDPTEISQQVIDFLGGALVYALTSAKRDIVLFLTETLIMVVSAHSPDQNSRQEMLKKIGETIATAPPLTPPPSGPPSGPPPGVPPVPTKP